MAPSAQSDPVVFAGRGSIARAGHSISTKRQHAFIVVQRSGGRQPGIADRPRHAGCTAAQARVHSRRGIRSHGVDRPGHTGLLYRLEKRHRSIPGGSDQSELARLGTHLAEAAFGIRTQPYGHA